LKKYSSLITFFLFTVPAHAWNVCWSGGCMTEVEYFSDATSQEEMIEYFVDKRLERAQFQS